MLPDFVSQAFAPQNWPTFVFVSARLGGMMLAAPLWSMSVMPRRVRAAITVLLAMLLLPTTPRVELSGEFLDLPIPLAMELVVGLAIGLTAAVIVQGVALAGEVVSLQMGLSIANILSPDPDLQVPALGQLKTLLALLLYVGVGGHLILLQGLAESLRVLPPGRPLDFVPGAGAATQLFGSLFSCAVHAAAPAMVTLLLANVALALLSRAVPQLNAMMVGFPLTIGVGLVTAGASLPYVGGVISGWLRGLPGSVEVILRSFEVH
jgi:flagellar biosynthetic protein FliR